ncbi:DNA-binding protein [Pilimelia terevasa]|uniref:DNA-binding protein n=1 Tax=Pilimelia terevasa TaxID=53372 RepID=A0A8J3FJT7_9ACTN|nr:dihydrofolate reductase family protein [Pilimelia terevasa]GGK42751.1 DNA-binding protein [Pilimelia terevasa]
MSQLRVHNLTMSVDGYVAGPEQSLQHPLGVGGERLHGWMFATRAGRAMLGGEGGTAGVDDAFVVRGDVGVGATVMGRNMFGPVRGPWPDEEWTGWWGPRPPYGHPVFVLTRHARPSVTMEGGTVFHFVTDGPESALARARAAAGGADVRLGGGAATIRQYLALGLVDHLHVVVAPVLLGDGERIFEPAADLAFRYECAPPVAGDGVTHLVLTRRPR